MRRMRLKKGNVVTKESLQSTVSRRNTAVFEPGCPTQYKIPLLRRGAPEGGGVVQPKSADPEGGSEDQFRGECAPELYGGKSGSCKRAD